MSIIDICEKVSFNSFDANGSIDKLTLKFKNMSQLIDDNRFIWILSSEDEMVCHTLLNLLHSLFEERSEQLIKNLLHIFF